MTTTSTRSRENRRRDLQLAGLLLLLEQRAKAGLRAAVSLPLRLAEFGAGLDIVQKSIEGTSARAVIRLRQTSRAALGGAFTAQAPDVAAPVLSEVAAADAERGRAAGASLARQWRKAHATAVAQDLPEDEAREHAASVLSSAAERTAATESAHALNDESKRWSAAAQDAGYRVIQTWVAVLDSRTCEACFHMDGEQRVAPDEFIDTPPVHSRCRCVIQTDFERGP